MPAHCDTGEVHCGVAGVEDSVDAERRVEFASLAINGIHTARLGGEHEALCFPLPPISDSAISEEVEATGPVETGIEFPFELAR